MRTTSHDSKNDMAQRLRTLLKGHSKSEIARKIGVTRQTVYEWERTGRISDDSLFKLCAILSVDPFQIKFETTYKTVEIDVDLLRAIISAVERYKKEQSMNLEPTDYAAMVASFYEIYKAHPHVDESVVLLALRASDVVAQHR